MIRWIGFRIVTWHIFWEIGAKMKNFLRLSHLYKNPEATSKKSSLVQLCTVYVHTLFSQVLQVEKGILKEALITSLFFLLYSWSHAERSTCSSTWKYKPSKKIERGAC